MLELFVGNRNYSSWSMRAGVLVRQAGIDCREIRVRLDMHEPDSRFRQIITPLNPAATVPLLRDGELIVSDSLAIAEYLAERFPDRQLWPAEVAARARARSACARMHAGFSALRQACPMNIEASLVEAGRLIWRDRPAVRADVQAIDTLWQDLLARHGGPLLFGGFSIADAYYAPIAMRLLGFGLPVSVVSAQYIQRVAGLPGVASWIADARAEHDFLVDDEPYRLAPDGAAG